MMELASICARVQHAIVEGALDEARPHAEACSECGFFLQLSRGLSGAWPSPSTSDESPLGAALSAALAASCERGEPLLGKWRLESRLGRGGQGEVYRAIDLEVGEPVAVKVVRLSDNASDDATAREVALARRIVHPGICRVFHTERLGQLRLIVMELVDGPSLATVTTPDPATAIAWWRAICEAVGAAHAAGVLHLDLKPGNILLRGGREPAILDFGLARASSAETHAGGGTVGFMAPEQQRRRPVDARTDVYALGRLGEQLLGARATRRQARLIRRATADEPSERPATANDLARELTGRRLPMLWIAAIGFCVLVAIVAVLVAIVPPPTNARAAWRAELWGVDVVPREAWNVARNTAGTGLPRVIAEPISACARRHEELLDGIAQYNSWEHGIAYPAPFDVCVSLVALAPTGICGHRRPDARICRRRDGQPFEILPIRMAQLDTLPVADHERLGQVEDALPCGDRTFVVELEREWPVSAVRQWVHEEKEVPSVFQIYAEVDGRWQLAFATRQNVEGTFREKQATGYVGNSAPITSTFPPIATRRVRVTFDSCTIPRGQGWLYEVEVFAVPARWHAWWLRLTGALS